MKIWKLISILLLVACVSACDDDNKISGEENGNNTGGAKANQVNVSFGYETKTVLKNAGQIRVPVKLSQIATSAVKVTVDAAKDVNDENAREGIDFNIPEKVVTVPAGDSIAFLPVELLDDGKVGKDRKLVLHIGGAYDGNVSSPRTCTLYIANNAFVEFQYQKRETYEAAGSYKIPVLVTGEISETTTFTVRVKEGGTALEGTHFTLSTTSFTLEKGAKSAEIEVNLVDDKDANADRWFDLEIIGVEGSNAIIGKGNSICRITIISEEVLKSVSFAQMNYTVKEGADLIIPIALDKAPAAGEDDVIITLSIKTANSTAVENTDFTLETKEIHFIPGQKEEEIIVHASDNSDIHADRYFELSIKAVTGANFGTIDACKVTIENDDFPEFAIAENKVEEDSGDHVFVVNLPAAQTTDMNLKFGIVAKNYAIAGKHYPSTISDVLIPAGETKGEVHVNIGYTENWSGTPEFELYVSEINGIELTNDICNSAISLTECAYRKLLGEWNMTVNNPDNCTAKTDATISLVTWQKEVKVVSSSLWNNQKVYFNMTYDKNTKGLKMVLNKQCEDHTWNFGGSNTSVILRLLVDGQYNLTDISMGGYDVENGIITLPIDKHIGGGGSNNSLTGNPTAWGFFFKNGTLVKK